jgi:protein-tyrosine phosphatase
MTGLADNSTEVRRVCEFTPVLSRYTDIHCHCLPGIDDGPSNMSEALDLCRALVQDGIGTVAATPHQLGRFDACNDAGEIRESVRRMNEVLHDNHIDLTVVPGGDVRVDERICDLLEADKVLTLGDAHRYVLLELPTEIMINIELLLAELEQLDVSVIISHPERYQTVVKKPQVIENWLRHSASLQITAGSLIGDFGQVAEQAAWFFLERGWANVVATDAHDVHQRRPCMSAAYECIAHKFSTQIARELCIENPTRVLQGADLPGVSDSSVMGRHYGGSCN